MPLFIFKCVGCDKEQTRIISSKVMSIACNCGETMNRRLPENVVSSVKVMADPHRGVQLDKNHDAKLKDRMRKHHDRYEVEEKIDKNGMDDAIKFGWTKRVKRV